MYIKTDKKHKKFLFRTQKRSDTAMRFQEYRVQYKNVVRVVANEACRCWKNGLLPLLTDKNAWLFLLLS